MEKKERNQRDENKESRKNFERQEIEREAMYAIIQRVV